MAWYKLVENYEEKVREKHDFDQTSLEKIRQWVRESAGAHKRDKEKNERVN